MREGALLYVIRITYNNDDNNFTVIIIIIISVVKAILERTCVLVTCAERLLPRDSESQSSTTVTRYTLKHAL